MRFSLLTFLLATICVGLTPYVYLHSSPWEPTERLYTLNEITAELKGKKTTRRSPDGSRYVDYDGSTGIQDSKNRRETLHLFSLRDSSSAFEMMYMRPTGETPMHQPIGFIDDDRLLLAHIPANSTDGEPRGRIWVRRYPEWWWGHLYRPEVWAMGVACLALAIQLFRGMRNGVKPIPSNGVTQPSLETPKPGTRP